jgi:hypothetical protein
MRTADLSGTTLSAYSSAESRVDHLANSCVPPVTEPFPAEDSFLGERHSTGRASFPAHPAKGPAPTSHAMSLMGHSRRTDTPDEFVACPLYLR